ncbi:hypothetical protein M6B38_254200 [Iris pallida]|nr:hypothetical protein M6B38_254200 [Iris pallida]
MAARRRIQLVSGRGRLGNFAGGCDKQGDSVKEGARLMMTMARLDGDSKGRSSRWLDLDMGVGEGGRRWRSSTVKNSHADFKEALL